MPSFAATHLGLLLEKIPEDHETLPFIFLPIAFHLLVLWYLISHRKNVHAVLAVEVLCLTESVVAALPPTIIPVLFAPRHFAPDQQASWSLLFFSLPGIVLALVGLAFSLQNVSRALDELTQSRLKAEARAKERKTARGATTAETVEDKKDI